MNRIAVIGAGASGMMAAIWAASEGASVTLYERNERAGKKLLQTGNGRCNYTNRRMSEAFYRGSAVESGLMASVLSRFGAEDTIRFFEELGIRPREKNGGIYPYPETASAVLDVLRLELSRTGVSLRTGCRIRRIERLKSGGFRLHGEKEGPFEADAVIVSTGGSAAPKTGSEGDGFRIAREAGLSVRRPLPALTLLCSPEPWFKGLAGIRAEAELSLFLKKKGDRREGWGERTAVSHGELQLTEQGLSGICAFELSGLVSRALSEGGSCEVRLNFLPGMDRNSCLSYFLSRRKGHPERRMESFFTGVFHKNLAALLLKRSGIRGSITAGEMEPGDFRRLAEQVTALPVPVKGTGDFSRSQVTSGGVDAGELDRYLMAVRIPGLFFTGEAVDADGICGGYNLQWAWATGAIAGKRAAELLHDKN